MDLLCDTGLYPYATFYLLSLSRVTLLPLRFDCGRKKSGHMVRFIL